jgi:hypothetical protein
MTRLLLILAVLAIAVAYPRAALMIAAALVCGCALAARWLLRHRTVFHLGRWSYA